MRKTGRFSSTIHRVAIAGFPETWETAFADDELAELEQRQIEHHISVRADDQ